MPIDFPFPHAGWPNCVRMKSAQLELIALADVGPRVIHFGPPKGENLLGVVAADLGRTDGAEFRFFGGHRLQYAPEVPERIYPSENTPVAVQTGPDWFRLAKSVEPRTGIERALTVRLRGEGVEIVHALTNHGVWPVDLAPWAVTIMAPGGVGLAPAGPAAPADTLLPDRSLVLWPYTRLDDPRLRLGGRYVTLRHDPAIAHRIKFGLTASEGWLAYLRAGALFVKTFTPQPGAPYPDRGALVEVFADGELFELETLGPLAQLQPGETAVHHERWQIFTNVEVDSSDDDAIERVVRPLAQQARARRGETE